MIRNKIKMHFWYRQKNIILWIILVFVNTSTQIGTVGGFTVVTNITLSRKNNKKYLDQKNIAPQYGGSFQILDGARCKSLQRRRCTQCNQSRGQNQPASPWCHRIVQLPLPTHRVPLRHWRGLSRLAWLTTSSACAGPMRSHHRWWICATLGPRPSHCPWTCAGSWVQAATRSAARASAHRPNT